MGEKKITYMLLKVDLNCSSCYKKVKKTLCKFPQIRDQSYDEKNNTVKITVLCCSPEKIRDKLCCKGGGAIKSIEILEPPKPKEPDQKPKEAAAKPKDAEKHKQAEKPKEEPKEAEKPKEKPKDAEKPKEVKKPKEAPKKPPPAAVPVFVPAPVPISNLPAPISNVPAPAPMALEAYPMPCFNGQYPGGPCYQGYGMPVALPQPCYDNYGNGYGYGYGYAYGQGQGQVQGGYYGYNNQQRCCLNRCDHYFSEDNPSSCAIM